MPASEMLIAPHLSRYSHIIGIDSRGIEPVQTRSSSDEFFQPKGVYRAKNMARLIKGSEYTDSF